jgi:hypothetical protein
MKSCDSAAKYRSSVRASRIWFGPFCPVPGLMSIPTIQSCGLASPQPTSRPSPLMYGSRSHFTANAKSDNRRLPLPFRDAFVFELHAVLFGGAHLVQFHPNISLAGHADTFTDSISPPPSTMKMFS